GALRFVHESPVDARTVAWTLAELCRRALPTIDPEPTRGSVPIAVDAAGFVLAGARRAPERPFRLAVDGRLPRPLIGVRRDGRLDLVPRDFAPAASPTVAPGGFDRLLVRVEARPGGC